jgi:choline dehydrogenase-like flavoprotein
MPSTDASTCPLYRSCIASACVGFSSDEAVGARSQRRVYLVLGAQDRPLHTGGRVVLSAGAIGTPQLLELSGVGPRDGLRRLSIDVVMDGPGVGRQLLDHPFIALIGCRPNSLRRATGSSAA